MRWKLLRRRFTISAPRMIVRSHLPWPLRWVVVALMLGFSAALALWAFELGKSLAGLDRDAKAELAQLRQEVSALRGEREKAITVANTAESLLKSERAAQEKLAQQVKAAESENLSLKADLGFFERLLPAGATQGVSIRALQAEPQDPGHLRFQLLVMQPGKTQPDFTGRYDVTLSGTLDGKPWTLAAPGGAQALQLKQYLRLEGLVEHPPQAVIKTIQARVLDAAGGVKATQLTRL
ncbi:MAG: hypothetical protein RJA98_3978 [Pseudomonadota bacterium]|jgi:hypothetical protein